MYNLQSPSLPNDIAMILFLWPKDNNFSWGIQDVNRHNFTGNAIAIFYRGKKTQENATNQDAVVFWKREPF